MGRARLAAGAALAAACALAAAGGGCGYHLSQRYVARGGADAIFVPPLENGSVEPELGVVVATAIREALARRGAAGGEGARARIEGAVAATEPVPSSPFNVTWRVGLEVRARLVVDGATVAEAHVRREGDALAGEDGLASETRRALALRRLADEAARELLRAFEAAGR